MNADEKRVALVTGANRGIGFQIARQLGFRKMTVFIGARNRHRGEEALQKLAAEKLDVHFLLLDVTDEKTIHSAVKKIEDSFGRLDVLVNNAGVMLDRKTLLLELSLTFFSNTLETNAYGPLLLSQACVPLMKKNGYGRIVNMSSTLGSLTDITSPESAYAEVLSPAYRLSKTLLNGITALLARELKGTNILVNSVCPGWVRTEMGGEQAPLTPEQAADTPVWLATMPDDGPTGFFFRERTPIPW